MAVQMRHGSHVHKVVMGIGRMFTMFPYWDISWLVGVSFTIGCLIFVACGLFYWLPIAFPSTEFHNEKVAGGATAFVGATLFQFGAILLFLESYNDRAETQFGGAMETLFVDRLKVHRSRKHRPKHFEAGSRPEQPETVDVEPMSSEPKQRSSSESSPDDPKRKPASDDSNSDDPKRQPTSDESSSDPGNTFTERKWQWYPSWHDFRTHYIYEIGFLASFTMSVGATIFYVAGIMALPGIFENLSEPALEGGYYFTYLFGGVLFALSSCLYILETQPAWYMPQPFKIGWHIGVWNLIGAVGWTLAASLGYCELEGCEYQGELALTWASAAFAFGSALQWYESLDKYVVVIDD